MTFEVAIVTDEGSPVTLLARQSADDPVDPITGAVGKSVILQVWATNAGGETLAESDPFGPVIAAGDTFIAAWAFAQTAGAVPTSPYPWTLALAPAGVPDAASLYPQSTAVGGVSVGLDGSSIGTAVIGTTGLTDQRRRGRMSANLTPVQCHFKISGLTSGQVYKIYLGFGRNTSTSNCNAAIHDSAYSSIYGVGPMTVPANDAGDINGNITTEAVWSAASDFGGTYHEVTAPSDGILIIARNAAIGGMQLNCIAITKKA